MGVSQTTTTEQDVPPSVLRSSCHHSGSLPAGADHLCNSAHDHRVGCRQDRRHWHSGSSWAQGKVPWSQVGRLSWCIRCSSVKKRLWKALRQLQGLQRLLQRLKQLLQGIKQLLQGLQLQERQEVCRGRRGGELHHR